MYSVLDNIVVNTLEKIVCISEFLNILYDTYLCLINSKPYDINLSNFIRIYVICNRLVYIMYSKH